MMWFSRSLLETAEIPRRKIHLDFHNSRHVPAVGHDFVASEFVQTLLDAHVDSIVLFAKDMHGYFYYPSAFGPMHPGLGQRDLLGEQVAACREAGIAVFAYYCTTWDNHLAETHPEWLSLKRDRSSYLPAFDEPPGWTALCMSNDDFVTLMLEHTREILQRYEVDGLWFDMPVTNHDQECYCRNCVRVLREAGLDIFDREVQGSRTQELLLDWLRRSTELAHELRPGILVDQNQQTRLGLHERVPYLPSVDIEALPTGHWGYPYFPMMARYARALEIPYTGLTGRFQRSWADFGGLKSVNQLALEVAAITAAGAGVSIGDQAPPGGRLDAAVYTTIAAAYGQLLEIDDYIVGAVSVAEAALVVDGPMITDFARLESTVDPAVREGALGVAKLLIENRVQFDVVQPGTADLGRYGVIFLPDGLPLSTAATAEIAAYARAGGRIIQCGSPHLDLSAAPWLDRLGVIRTEESPFVPAYGRRTGTDATAPWTFDFALYDGAARWFCRPVDGVQVLATLGEPMFQRSAEHYTSHEYAPVHRVTDHPVALASSRHGAFAFPLGTGYQRHGYWIYAELFSHVLERVLPARLVTSDAPPSLELSITYQRSTSTRPARLLVHAVNFTAGSRQGAHLEYFDVVVPLHDVTITIRPECTVTGVRSARSGDSLRFTSEDGVIRTTVPTVEQSEVIVFDLESDLPVPTSLSSRTRAVHDHHE